MWKPRSFGVHVGQRLHAATHQLFRSSDYKETDDLCAKLWTLAEQHGVATKQGHTQLVYQIITTIADGLNIPRDRLAPVMELVGTLMIEERLFIMPKIDWDEKRGVSEWWELRDELNRQRALLQDFEATTSLITNAIIAMLEPVYEACPALRQTDSHSSDDIIVPSPLTHILGDTGSVIEAMMQVLFVDEVLEAKIFSRTADKVEGNLIAASGGNRADKAGFSKTPVPPSQSSIKDPQQLADAYLGGTALHEFLNQGVSFAIPTEQRFEHHHIVAGTGHGKTQTLQYLIGEDLAAVAAGKRSVVVIDSQGDLINNISQLKEFAPAGPLHDRLVLIDPTDVEYPVSLNLFDIGMERLDGYSPLERERLTNSILELYDFVLGSLLDAGMTQKQNVIFRYVTRLMMHIPNATIHTLRELLEPEGKEKFAPHIAKLSGSARHFFQSEFDDKEFKQTRRQVLRRLWGILENQTFERMFSHPKSKLDVFSELNSGKIILINTAKDLLKEQGAQIFGRFFIALIAQAAQERSTIAKKDRMPTIVYCDEAADYFDRTTEIILTQARKYNVGMVLAHQYLGQLDPKLQDAIATNTSIKFAGGVSAKDAKALAPMLRCDPDFIEKQDKGIFAAHIRGVTKAAVPLRFPLGAMEKKPRMSADERQILKDKMRAAYAMHYSQIDVDEKGVDAEVMDEQLNTSVNGESENSDPFTSVDRGADLDQIDLTPTNNW